MNEQTPAKFTIFCDSGYVNNSAAWAYLGSLDVVLARAIEMGWGAVAWAPEWSIGGGGDKQWDDLKAESIAAGRVIKLIDGKYIPFGEGAPLYCDAQGEPIAPTFYCAAETIKPAIAALKAKAVWWFDANEPQPEKLRPRLTWADSKAADRFPGFSSSSDTATPDHAYNHYLTRVADAGAQVSAQHGSAHILPNA